MIEELWSSLIAFTSQFVVPDWGSLIALLPVLLAIPVFVYITWTAYRFATAPPPVRPGSRVLVSPPGPAPRSPPAGPPRRGKRRLPPAPPQGIHMPGPSFAPFIAAVGAMCFVFGMVVGDIWLPIGFAIL